MTDKNRCAACGEDFYTVRMFDIHRRDFKIVSTHSAQECQSLISKGTHPRGECQVLVGQCLRPQDLRWKALGGTWYDSEGVITYEKLESARASRTSRDRAA